MLSLNALHRVFAAPILLFIAIHLLNHIVSIAGIDAHIEFMNTFRILYRNLIFEVILLFCLLAQISVGIFLVFRYRHKRRDFFSRLQIFSGLYIAFFVFLHVTAVLNGRYSLGLDTNFYFASAGMHIGQLKLFFIPYYLLAVVAVFTHVACFVRRRVARKGLVDEANTVAALIIVVGTAIGVLILSSLGGVFYDVSVPDEYRSMF